MSFQKVSRVLLTAVDSDPDAVKRFFKTGPGAYAEFDQFLGIRTPTLRKIARDFQGLSLAELQLCLQSQYNEERLLALIVLVRRYQRGNASQRESVYQFYLAHTHAVNNWNLVDVSAHHILGAHLWQRDRQVLFDLARSKVLWDRRIAVVATWYFIKREDCEDTLRLVEVLLDDREDLMHKACGWMLREVGKVNHQLLRKFLENFRDKMPRVMLRYAIEKFSGVERKKFL